MRRASTLLIRGLTPPPTCEPIRSPAQGLTEPTPSRSISVCSRPRSPWSPSPPRRASAHRAQHLVAPAADAKGARQRKAQDCRCAQACRGSCLRPHPPVQTLSPTRIYPPPKSHPNHTPPPTHPAIDMSAAGLTMKDFLKFDVVNAACATVLMGASFGAIMPTLSPHLEKQLKLRDTAHVGLTYMIPALVYGVSCPFVGAISDRLGYRKIIALGFTLLTVAFVMMGAHRHAQRSKARAGGSHWPTPTGLRCASACEARPRDVLPASNRAPHALSFP